MTLPPIFNPTLENREKLAALLQDPVLVSALRQVADNSRVLRPAHFSQVSEIIARKAAYHEGQCAVIEALADLTKPKAERPDDLASWDHVEEEPIIP